MNMALKEMLYSLYMTVRPSGDSTGVQENAVVSVSAGNSKPL